MLKLFVDFNALSIIIDSLLKYMLSNNIIVYNTFEVAIVIAIVVSEYSEI